MRLVIDHRWQEIHTDVRGRVATEGERMSELRQTIMDELHKAQEAYLKPGNSDYSQAYFNGMTQALRFALEQIPKDDFHELSMSQMRDQLRQLQAKVDSLSTANELAAAVCSRLDDDVKRALSAQGLRA